MGGAPPLTPVTAGSSTTTQSSLTSRRNCLKTLCRSPFHARPSRALTRTSTPHTLEGPRGLQNVRPRRPQEGPSGLIDGPERHQESLKLAQEGLRRDTRRPERAPSMAPRRPQETLQTARRASRRPTRAPRRPTRAQSGSRGPQGDPMTAPQEPQTALRRPK